MVNMPEALLLETNTDPLTPLGRLLTNNTTNKILLNIQIAAMHLADTLRGVGNLTNLLYINSEIFLD